MNVNCYYIVCFSVKSFYPQFRSVETQALKYSYTSIVIKITVLGIIEA